ncbi:PD-(D/E)XK nuclease family protein [Bacillus sinesaloumensis]|uniref:PD-(D/E)XK nuclease family protein n=1 Tax=Litchfieldia sinesaloumensis TaxID=1926280 RepID=UPI0009885DA0|nr:PD-(D/E)XK nuclease family protein [Bacillus sinesaloumensis]
MEVLIKQLERICKQYLLTEKILLVDTYKIGEQIVRAYTQKDKHAVNIKIKTIKDFALDVSQIEQKQLIEDAVGAHLLYSLLNEYQPSFEYFKNVEITPTLGQSMYQTVKRLRLAGYTSDSLNVEHFVSPAKGEDIRLILQSYEQLLEKHNLVDDAELYQRSLEKYNASNQVLILQSNLTLAFLQTEFLKTMQPATYFHLPMEAVRGLPAPEMSSFSKVVYGDETPLSYLYDIEHAKETVQTLSLFTAKTEEMELKEVLFRTKEKGIKFDEAAIYYSASPRYVTAMYHLAERLQIPVTFGEGIPIGFTTPGKLVSGILEWMKEFYSVQVFLKLLQENLIDLGEDAPTKAKMAAMLRGANIGWGQERYLSQLKMKIAELNDSGDRVQEYQWLLKLFTTMFKHMPNLQRDGTIVYRDLLKTIQFLLHNYCRVSSGFDHAAKEALLDRVESLLPYANDVIPEPYQKVNDDLLSIRTGKSRPRPGFLHMSTYKEGIFMNREHLFIVGLDNQRFPGKSGEDPLLLDTERKKLGRLLPLEGEKSNRDLYMMLQLFASSANKEITVSYCRFSINENRAVTPSYLFLQCYRIHTGDVSVDFQTLRQKVPIADRKLPLERGDWWTHKITNTQYGLLDDSLVSEFANVKRGLQAEKMRLDPAFTVYEGKIESDTTDFDPRKNHDLMISAGKLEKIAKCPYAFFLGNVLRLRVNEEITYDSSKWLDAKTRGTLLHEIFESYYKEIKARKERPSYGNHLELLTKLAKDKLKYVKTLIPPPNARTERLESEEIIESCETFLRIEEENSAAGEPLYFEYSFGEDSPAVIELPSGNVRVRGIIDRVDRLPDGTYHIIDYKTGSSWGYKTKEFFKGGRQLQHLLYTLAIEAHLGIEEGTVKQSSYLFPTKKGAGKRFVREQEETTRTNGKDIVDKLLSIVEHGHFTMTDDENECTFCEFKTICRRSTYDKDALKQKQQDETAQGLKSFLGVRAYD